MTDIKKGPGPAPHDSTDSVCKIDVPEDIREEMVRKRAKLTVHSYIYYVLGKNVVSDSVWDRWGQELRDLQEKYGYEIGYYDEPFEGFTGSTGMNLPRNDHIHQKALKILRYEEEFDRKDIKEEEIKKSTKECLKFVEKLVEKYNS